MVHLCLYLYPDSYLYLYHLCLQPQLAYILASLTLLYENTKIFLDKMIRGKLQVRAYLASVYAPSQLSYLVIWISIDWIFSFSIARL